MTDKLKPCQYEYYANKIRQTLEEITPICKAFNINNYGYEIEENGNEYLVLNETKIGCTGNSVSAVVDELIAYVFITIYCKSRNLGAFHKQTVNHIKRYWRADNERQADRVI